MAETEWKLTARPRMLSGVVNCTVVCLVVIPMAGAVVVMLTPGALKQQIRWVSSAFALSALLVSFYVFWAYDH
jgi:NADH:ubiquinone oxidoreductase subunit 4 (subunit M)